MSNFKRPHANFPKGKKKKLWSNKSVNIIKFIKRTTTFLKALLLSKYLTDGFLADSLDPQIYLQISLTGAFYFPFLGFAYHLFLPGLLEVITTGLSRNSGTLFNSTFL
jgi:hypothetical protein